MQHANVAKPNGNRPISIDVAGEPLGIVIPEGGSYRFLAVRFSAFAIDGKVFASVAAAREAARRAIRSADAAD